ncbi:hypothetical protein OS493_005969 [Desmophyllum pertusum]|uniref:Copper transport protein n=1 Tax=Desmophyllum pertusum TaxID=174260 RepID=A0A9W9YFL5_9CNID|nr:hypothetical protein OS493_005969 [Desmophyllum pertusum]
MSHGSHGGMEHSTMVTHTTNNSLGHSDKSHQSGHGESAGHVMMFHLRTNLNLLFEPWDISTTKVLVGSCIAVLFVSALYEGLKIFRGRLMNMHTGMEQETEHETDAVHIMRSHQGCRQNMCSFHHLTQTVIHVVQVVVGYLLMLVVMTYQVYLGIAVIFGAGLGYFLFALLLSEKIPRKQSSSSESPAIVLKVTNLDEIRDKQQVEKPSFSDLAIENKAFDIDNNDDYK